jgi:hypothetical protein
MPGLDLANGTWGMKDLPHRLNGGIGALTHNETFDRPAHRIEGEVENVVFS